MKLLGIELVPLNLPLRKRLETLATAIYLYIFTMSGFTFTFLAIYLILYTCLWLPTLLYLLWIWFIDKETCEKGGRQFKWLRKWFGFKYIADYFPVKLESLPGVVLDPRRNYLFACFPHGILGMGFFCSFFTEHCGVSNLFPHHKVNFHILKMNLVLPLTRDLAMAMGGVSSSANSLRWCLTRPEGGMLSLLSIGGASETYLSRPGEYRVLLKNRKGFVKIALQTGTPLVPVIGFGEPDIYNQVEAREGSFLRKLQEVVRKTCGFAPIIALGRGFFQYNFGIIPFNKPITVVVGHPIDVKKNENPTQENIDELHKTFVNRLINLFESEKYKYLMNADNTQLFIH